MTELPIFDRQAALDSVDGHIDILVELATTFLDYWPKLVHKIQDAVRRRDTCAVAGAAHDLRGTLGYFGAPRVIAAVEKLEQSAANRNLAELDAAGSAIETCIEQLRQSLLEFIRQPQDSWNPQRTDTR